MYNNKSASLELLTECGVPKDIMLSTYKSLIREELLTPIENLMIEEKMKLWEECKKHIFVTNKIPDAARILHTINFINANS